MKKIVAYVVAVLLIILGSYQLVMARTNKVQIEVQPIKITRPLINVPIFQA
jgi:uncharacterized protein YxeA